MSTVRKLGVALVTMTVLLAACRSSTTPTTRSSTSTSGTSTTTKARTTATTISPPQDVDAVHFLNANVGWATEIAGPLRMTTNGGARWRDVPRPKLHGKVLGFSNTLAGASFLSRSDFWVIAYGLGRDVFLFHTTDAGRKWVQAGSFPNDEGAWVSFMNDRLGWVAVNNGEAGGAGSVTIYETTNGGRHWSLVSRSRSLVGVPGTPNNPGTCDDTGFSTSGTARAPVLWLSGASNLAPCLACSADGGSNWRDCPGPTDPSQFCPPDPWKGWGGEVWPPVFSRLSGALVAFYGTPHGDVTVFCSTSDGGQNWIEHRPPAPGFGPTDLVSSTTWFTVAGKAFYRTKNGGIGWSRIATKDLSGSSGTGSLDFVNSVDGWAILRSGRLWHTTDGGRVWKPELLPR